MSLAALAVGSAFSASILVVKLSMTEALLATFIERSNDGMTWDIVESASETVEAGSSMFVLAESVSPGFLRLRFTLGQGNAVLSVATHTNPLDPRYRDDSVFRLTSNNILKPWTKTS